MRNKPILNSLLLIALVVVLTINNSTGYARPFFGRTLQLPLQKVAPGNGEILMDFILPPNHEFAEEAPSTLLTRTKHPEILTPAQSKPAAVNLLKLPFSIPYSATPGTTVVAIDARIHFCDEASKICLSDLIRIKFPIQIETGAPSKLSFRIPLQSKSKK